MHDFVITASGNATYRPTIDDVVFKGLFKKAYLLTQ